MNFSEEICQDFSNDSTILAIDSFRSSYIPTISIIGCLGNVLSLIVLAKINDCFHRLLFVLACIDLMVPLLCTLLLLLDQLQQGKMDVFQIIPNALLEAGFSGSGWMTVSISFERFSSFVLTPHPLHPTQVSWYLPSDAVSSGKQEGAVLRPPCSPHHRPRLQLEHHPA